MIFPLFPHDEFGRFTGQVLGVLLGMGFGLVLERAGFGRAANLAAQFYGGDNRVFKVMFTGIATTTASLGLLSAFGFLDLSLVTVPETFLWPQAVGGLLLGVGFVVAGYCPGTGVVAAATGSIDGIVTYVGVAFGTFVFGFFWPELQGFYTSGSMGTVTLDQWLGLPFPVVAAAVVAMAAGAFFGAEALERWLAGRRGTSVPDQAVPALRNRSLVAVGLLAGLALLPSVMPTAAATPAAATVPGLIEATRLAEALVDDPRSLWIVDLRDSTACAKATVPGALCRPDGDEDARFVADLAPGRTLVVVDTGGAALPDAVATWPGTVLRLDGGMAAFQAEVLTPPALQPEPSLAQVATYRRAGALHGYLTGTTAPTPPAAVVRRAPRGAAPKKGGGC